MTIPSMTRRQALLAGAAGALAAAEKAPSRLSFAGYIWQNYAAREKKPLAELLDELFATAPYGGFENIELSNPFFEPALKDRVVGLIRSNHLSTPSIYVGGPTHEKELADKTIARALELGALCKQFRCAAIVNNPGSSKAPKGRKTDDELAIQADSLNRMGRTLAEYGFQLRMHHHTVEMEEDAREWRHILKNTDPKYVTACIDLELVHKGGMKPNAILREAGSRVTELHLRNKKKDTPLESFEDGDIDYYEIAATLKELKLKPLLVVELAYHPETLVTRPLKDDMRLSRAYAERLFSL
jgi:sugar phosphate isomerase/epimerase